MSSCCSKNLWPRVLPGSAPASQIRAPDTFWTVKGRPGRLNLAYGPIRIMRCSIAETPKDTLARRGQFALIEGKVASVREKRADNLREFRPAAAWGHYGYDPETKRAQFRGSGS